MAARQPTRKKTNAPSAEDGVHVPPADRDAVLDGLRQEDLRRQISLARSEYGKDFDAMPLTLMLMMHRTVAALWRAESFELDFIGLSGTLFNILMVLHRSPTPVTMGNVADAVSVKPPNLTAAVHDLERRQLIRRKPHTADKRSYLLEITERGEALINPFLPGHLNFLQDLFQPLSEADRVAVVKALDAILSNLVDEETGGISDHIIKSASHGDV